MAASGQLGDEELGSPVDLDGDRTGHDHERLDLP
jgi:hypothetical protein